jgi:hypothetical protein
VTEYAFVNTISRGLQVHKGSDDKLYLYNLHYLRPPSISRRFSFDPILRVLRPELLFSIRDKSSSGTSLISPQVVQDDDIDSIDLAQSFIGQESKIRDTGSKGALLNMVNMRLLDLQSSDKVKLSTALVNEAIVPSGILHTKIIPEAVQMLVMFCILNIFYCSCVIVREQIRTIWLSYLWNLTALHHFCTGEELI